MASRINPAAFSNAFAQQLQLGAQMRASDQDEQIRAGQIKRADAINALGTNPDATPEQFIRAGDAATGNALASVQANQQAQQAQAFPRIGQIATQISQIADPAQKRAAFKQAILQNGSLFDSMGMPHTDALAKVDQTDDLTLDATLAKLSSFAPKAAPIEVAAGASLVRPKADGTYDNAFTAPTKPSTPGENSPFGKINPSEYTRESLTKFQSTGNVADLVPAKVAPSGQGFSQAQELRKEFNNQSATFRGVADSYQRILDSSKDPSPAGDLSLIFNYMKVLDPGSTVREGEFATAEQAGSIPARVLAQYNKVLNGERLAPQQRTDFVDRSSRLYKGQEGRFKSNVIDRYTALANRYGLAPEEIIGPVGQVSTPQDQPQAAAAPAPGGQPVRVNSRADALKLPPGTAFITPDGRTKYVPQAVPGG